MNHIYRLAWNTRQAAYVPVPESARGHRPGSTLRTVVASILATLAVSAQALPTGGQVSAGQGNLSQNGNALTVNQQSQNLSINWQRFGIGAKESVTFAQPNASSIALNRVLGPDPSAILGRLNANGQVWLLNPNGVLFGSGAQVNVGGLVASTLNLSDTDFLAGKRTFTGKGGTVLNQGSLKAADGGYIALLGGRVSNNGVIQAKLGTVALGAGNQVTLDFAGDKLLNLQVDEGALKALAQNRQLIQADGGTVLMSAKAAGNLMKTVVNNQGVVEARTIDTHTGTIKLLGENGTTRVAGTLDASAPNGGNGGFIETSGDRVKVVGNANITTQAPRGQTGQWLIDPTDYTIAAGGGDMTGSGLSSLLEKGDVTIQSSQGKTQGVGDINVNDTVSWASSSRLTLSALHSVNVNNPISTTVTTTSGTRGRPRTVTTSGSGSVTLLADNAGLCVAGATNCGAVTFGKFGNKTGSINVTGGSVNIYYNPVGSNTAADANGNGPTYATPTNFSSKVALSNGSVLTAWMLVNDVNQLQAMNTNLSGTYALGRNIDASATGNWNGRSGFVPVGNGANQFSGQLDGGGLAISRLTINRPNQSNVGLFGYTGGGKFTSIGLQDVSVVGGNSTVGSVGGLVGQNGGAISNSYSTGTVTGAREVGGLVGANYGAVSNSYSTASVMTPASNGAFNTGGLVGFNGGNISSSYSTGAVSGQGRVGGLAGRNNGTISNSYSISNVTGQEIVGGLVGFSYGTISDSFSAGAVTGQQIVGGLVGQNAIRIINSYSTGTVSGQQTVGGLVGYDGIFGNGEGVAGPGTEQNSYYLDTAGPNNGIGTPLTSDQMKDSNSFVGFNFTTVWTIDPNASYPYPTLRGLPSP